MILSNNTALDFASHLFFLPIKMWFVYKLSVLFDTIQAPRKEKFMLMYEKNDITLYFVSIMLMLDEMYYLSTYFYRAIPHEYNYIEIIGVIYIMIYIVNKMKVEKP